MRILTLNEEIILGGIWKLGGTTYGIPLHQKIQELTKKDMVYGTLYNSLEYLINKGFVKWKKGNSTPERGGKRKTLYTITYEGKIALQNTKDLHDTIWQKMPDLELKPVK